MTLADIQSTTATDTMEEPNMAEPNRLGGNQSISAADVTFTKSIDMMRCPKCEHEWLPRTPEPRQCPGCNFRLFKLWEKNKETK